MAQGGGLSLQSVQVSFGILRYADLHRSMDEGAQEEVDNSAEVQSRLACLTQHFLAEMIVEPYGGGDLGHGGSIVYQT